MTFDVLNESLKITPERESPVPVRTVSLFDDFRHANRDDDFRAIEGHITQLYDRVKPNNDSVYFRLCASNANACVTLDVNVEKARESRSKKKKQKNTVFLSNFKSKTYTGSFSIKKMRANVFIFVRNS